MTEAPHLITFTTYELLAALKGVIRFVHTDTYRPNINVVHLAVDEHGHFNVVATNGHCLAIWSARRALPESRKASTAYSIPLDRAKHLLRDLEGVFRADKEKRKASGKLPQTEVVINTRKNTVETADSILKIPTPSDKFPAYWKVLQAPASSTPPAQVDSKYTSMAMQAFRDVMRVDRSGGLSYAPVRIELGATPLDPITFTSEAESTEALTVIVMPLRSDHPTSTLPKMIQARVGLHGEINREAE